MKKLYLIGGTMGVGKTTVCQILKKKLDRSVFLDGDWCWDMSPFQVTSETKKMVLENIVFLLNNFIRCSVYEHIIFCWVMHQQEIINDILFRLDGNDCEIYKISLICSKNELRRRLWKDVSYQIRGRDIIDRSLERVSLYENLDTIKVDVSACSPEETAEKIILLCRKKYGEISEILVDHLKPAEHSERMLEQIPVSDLRKIPGIGANMEQHLKNIGIHCVADLAGKDPEELYHLDCLKKGFQEDRCVLYVFRCAVYFAEHEQHEPEKLKWWYWKDKEYPEKE